LRGEIGYDRLNMLRAMITMFSRVTLRLEPKRDNCLLTSPLNNNRHT